MRPAGVTSATKASEAPKDAPLPGVGSKSFSTVPLVHSTFAPLACTVGAFGSSVRFSQHEPWHDSSSPQCTQTLQPVVSAHLLQHSSGVLINPTVPSSTTSPQYSVLAWDSPHWSAIETE